MTRNQGVAGGWIGTVGCGLLAAVIVVACGAPPSPPAQKEAASVRAEAIAPENGTVPAPLEVPLGSRRIQIVGDQFYDSGIRVLLRGTHYGYSPIGYTPAHGVRRPPEDHLRRELRALREAGFNTLRWYEPSARELEIADEMGMLVFQQLWIQDDADFSDRAFQDENLARLREIVRTTRGHGNVIGYMIMNEPRLSSAMDRQPCDEALAFFRRVRDMIREEDPGAPVSLADWVPLVTLDHSFWDFVCFNVYSWGRNAPGSFGMGYRPFVEYLKQACAIKRPLVITEYGASVAPTDYGKQGFGGLTEAQQADLSLAMLRDLLQAGASGMYVCFSDVWWFAGKPDVHDDHPNEWFGLRALDPRGGADVPGRWRPVYEAHKSFQRLVVAEPPDCVEVKTGDRILVQSDSATAVRYRLDDGAWQELEPRRGGWWEGKLSDPALTDGLHAIEFAGSGPWETEERRRTHVVIADHRPDTYRIRVDVKVDPASDDSSAFRVLVTRAADGRPVAGVPVHWDYFEYAGWVSVHGVTTTDSDGLVLVDARSDASQEAASLLADGRESKQGRAEFRGFREFSAGVEVEQGAYRRRFGGYIPIPVE